MLNVDDASIFNPWHAVLYAGFLLTVLWVCKLCWRGGGIRRETIPAGYGLALAGGPLFLLSGVADLTWHTFFGFESALDSAMSPPHLGLFLSGMILITGPIRAALARYDTATPSLGQLVPGIIAYGFAVAATIGWFSVFLLPLPWGPVEGPFAPPPSTLSLGPRGVISRDRECVRFPPEEFLRSAPAA